jgi:uncharacterized SAM-binding protein YcdF (DUF218 family)
VDCEPSYRGSVRGQKGALLELETAVEPASDRQGTSLGSSSHRSVWTFLAVVAAVVALFLSLSAKLFVWPAQNALQGAHADAIVVLGGPGPRWQVAVELAKEHAAPIMLVSVASTRWNCPGTDLAGVRIECFRPDPFSTMGEARFVASQARAHGWHSLIVVSSTPQATRARLRVKRCFDGSVYVVTASPRLRGWPAEVIYEWGALIKALVWQTTC